MSAVATSMGGTLRIFLRLMASHLASEELLTTITVCYLASETAGPSDPPVHKPTSHEHETKSIDELRETEEALKLLVQKCNEDVEKLEYEIETRAAVEREKKERDEITERIKTLQTELERVKAKKEAHLHKE
ncbi:hypothetical protein HDV00_012474 [Rhizophlyctis rosea]|nr:hypothetical protein HDV00_012474 [Rhizophlyctis rosea]